MQEPHLRLMYSGNACRLLQREIGPFDVINVHAYSGDTAGRSRKLYKNHPSFCLPSLPLRVPRPFSILFDFINFLSFPGAENELYGMVDPIVYCTVAPLHHIFLFHLMIQWVRYEDKSSFRKTLFPFSGKLQPFAVSGKV